MNPDEIAAQIAADVATAVGTSNARTRARALAAVAREAYTLAGGEDADTFVASMDTAIAATGTDADVDAVTRVFSTAAFNAAARASDPEATFTWITMRDDAVRDLHRPLDGQTADAGAPFDVGGFPLMYPGQPVGPPEVWINCRCTLVPAPVTAATDPPHTGAVMVARPADPDSLAVPGGLPADELHITIGYYGDISEATPELERDLRAFAAEARVASPETRVSGRGLLGDDDPQAVVMLVENPDLNRLRAELEAVALPDGTHPHYTPHMTLGYGIDMPNELPQTFDLDRVELWWGDERIGGDMGNTTASNTTNQIIITTASVPYVKGDCPDGQHQMPDGSCMDDAEMVARAYDTDKRRKMADSGTAMPDGSFPIADVEDLRNAIQAIGRAKDPDAAKRHIRKRARALHAENLIPEAWTASGVDLRAPDVGEPLYRQEFPALVAVNTHDGPGWLTNPRETQRLRTYWTKGAGAGKIRWGAPGDFNRCRKQLAKYVKTPFLAGTCANLHHVALGFWPGQPPHGRRKGRVAAAEETYDFDTTTEEFTAVTDAFAAAATLDEELPPLEWFTDPGFDAPSPLTVTADGRVLGHLATWGTCHVGKENACVTAPHSQAAYAYFRTGEVETAGGERVSVGQITMDTGHASTDLGPTAAVSHYDDTGTVVADVAAGEDAHGIWVAGHVRPGTTDAQLRGLRAGALSGDWRRIAGNLELVAALVVNVPGFPIPRTELVAASGAQFCLIAAAIVEVDPNALDADRVAVAVISALDEREAARDRAARAATLQASLGPVRVARLFATVS